jgi:uncharacterized protein (TIGR00369 family)
MTERTLTIHWDEPQGRLETRHMSGREFLEAIVAGKVPHSPLSQLMGFAVTEVEDGRVVVECTPGEQHGNFIGIVHGGVTCTLLDSCMGGAIQSITPTGFAATTLETKVNFVRPITPAVGKLVCEGKIVHGGRRIATAEGRVMDAKGALYAHGTSTMMIFPLGREGNSA